MASPHSVAVGFADLLEREPERRGAHAALERALGGDGTAIAFEASAGIGKTSLLRALSAEAHARGARVLSARGVELEHGLAFGLVGQLFMPALASASAAERGRLLAGAARFSGPVVGLTDEPPAAGPPGAALHGLYWLCANVAERNPLVLAVDDAHWADGASLRFLVHLTHRFAGLRLLVAVTARPAEAGAERELLGDLLYDEGTRLHRLAPLSPAACGAMVRQRLGADASDDLCAACYTATGGNPFLVGELTQALNDEGVDARVASGAAVKHIGPRTVARSVLVRLSRMSADAVELARAVAIFPDGADFRHIAALAELDERSAARAADQLVEVAILAPGRPVSFLHPVMRTAVYQDLPPASRALLHLGAARLLRSEGAGAAVIATHLLATHPGTDAQAFADLVAAAGGALVVGAAEAALRYLDRALEEPLPPPARASGLHLRGIAGMLAGSPRTLDDLRAAVAAVPDPDPALLRDLARVLAFSFQTAEAAAALDAAVAATEGCDPDLYARCVIDRTWVLWSHDETAPRYVADMRATPVAEQPEGLLEHAQAANRSSWEAWHCESAERARTFARRGLGNGLLAAEGFDGLPPLTFAAVALALADHPREGLDAVDAALVAQRRTGAEMGLTYGHMIAGMIRLYAGDLADAESDLQLALDFARGQLAGSQGEMGIQPLLAIVSLERRGLAAAQELLEGLPAPPTWGGLHVLVARGHVAFAAGRMVEALDDLTAALRSAQARGLRHPLYPIPWRGELALAAAAVGEDARARAQAEEDLARARSFGTGAALGGALRIAGLVVGGESGLALLSQAVTALSASSARLLYAETLADFGAALRRANQRVAAREPLRLAIDLARRCGSDRLRQRAAEDLLASGGRPRRAFVSGVEALTPSELRVARLAADGLTNREIAQQLYVTIKTVEMHVGNALSKLALSSRRQLGDIDGLAAPDAAVPTAKS